MSCRFLKMGAPASRWPCHAACGTPLQSWQRFPSAMPKRKFKIINSKFETGKSFKVQVFSFKRRQKTSRQKKLDQKLLPPKSTTRVSYLLSAKRFFVRDQQSTILSSLPFVFLRVHSRFKIFIFGYGIGSALDLQRASPQLLSQKLRSKRFPGFGHLFGWAFGPVGLERQKMTGQMAIFFL